jgi:hypothetical protein
VGQTILLVIPGTKIDYGTMMKSEIVHISTAGFGVKFSRLVRQK